MKQSRAPSYFSLFIYSLHRAAGFPQDRGSTTPVKATQVKQHVIRPSSSTDLQQVPADNTYMQPSPETVQDQKINIYKQAVLRAPLVLLKGHSICSRERQNSQGSSPGSCSKLSEFVIKADKYLIYYELTHSLFKDKCLSMRNCRLKSIQTCRCTGRETQTWCRVSAQL